MNIYFIASRTQVPIYGENYKLIIKVLKEMGHTVDDSYVYIKRDNNVSPEELARENKDFLKRISGSDLIVAELSFPSSINIGYRIRLALEKNHPILGLYVKEKKTSFFETMDSDKFIYEEYTLNNLKRVLDQSLITASEKSDIRFNFILPPSLIEYLDWISQNERIPRSVYLRKLIEKDKEKNLKYHS